MDWIHVDWRKTNKALAEELGCSVVTVNKARKKYYPDDPYQHDSERFWDSIDWEKSAAQIREETGASWATIRINRHKYDRKYHGADYSRREEAYKVYQAYLRKHNVKKRQVKTVGWLYR